MNVTSLLPSTKKGKEYPYRRISTVEELKRSDADADADAGQQQEQEEKVISASVSSNSLSSNSLSYDSPSDDYDDGQNGSTAKQHSIEMIPLHVDHPNNQNRRKNNKLSREERRALREYEQQQKIKEAEEQLAERALKRSMTSNQELWNAITMFPTPLYCIFFCLGGHWLTQSDIDRVSNASDDWESTFNSSSCNQSSILPNFYALPPPPIIAMTVACVLHSPCSIFYHLLCAYKLPPGAKRMDHWARRLDQAMIHFMSFMFAYATSGNTDYFLIAMAFNIDCMYRLTQKGMRPKRTLIRMVCAFFIPVLPFFVRGNWVDAFLLLSIYGVSGWFFSAYPVGGWSHGIFHLMIFTSNPILMYASLKLDVDEVRDYVDTAAKCFLLANENNNV